MATYYGTDASETFFGTPGRQYSVIYDSPLTGPTYIGEANEQSLYLSGDGNDTLIVLDGSTPDKIYSMYWDFRGEAGDDRVFIDTNYGGEKQIYFDGGEGTDTLEISAQIDQQIDMGVWQTGESFVTWVSFGNIPMQIVGLTSTVERLVVTGSSRADFLLGLSGNDWLDGGGGIDYFKGSSGDDGYVFDSSAEYVPNEDAGIDTIWTTASQNLNRSAGVENLRLQADVNGTGNALANMITGSAGTNIIAGGLGKDQLWGKGGNDTFSFAEMGSENRDTIYDFNEGDRIQLSKAAFAGLDVNNDGMLDAISLTGKAAGGAYAQLIYSAKTGVLSYDADGTGSGAAQEIAVIGKNLGFLGTDDFLLVA